ncbi:universal stress protein [Indiicoccus explosivorum]|uniref:universal stress protein n=1 Tax=Indiicoccus explosivorum TaxID=1917864 RepID=UPI000B42DB28|nr:universal stress protein [Indiicoccus explosivorum]
MYGHIAVGYDGSSGSRKALDQAIEMKKAMPDARLSVIYVSDAEHENVAHAEPEAATFQGMTLISDGAYSRYMPPELGAEFNEDERVPETGRADYVKTMHTTIQQHLQDQHVKGEVLAVEGDPAKTISAFADEQQIDLLIVGNSGKSGLQKFFVGSVSEKVLKEAPCSVLIVK